MRIISYNEYLYRFKDNGYYTEDIIPYLKESKENFKNYILEQDRPIFIFNHFNDIIHVLEALHYDQIFTLAYINQCFEEIEINSTEIYKLIYKYAIAYQCRAECTYFPFRLHIDVNMLKEKLKNAPSEFIVPNYSYNYSMSFLEKPDYDELINYSRFHKNFPKRREQFINNKMDFTCGQFYLEWLGGFGMSIRVLFNQLQIFIEEGLTTNNEINKILSEFTLTKRNAAINFYYYYAKEMIYLNLFKWHRYTVDLDINMLTNKIAIYFKSNDSNDDDSFSKNGIVNYFHKHGYLLDYYDKSLEDCIKINEYYREKYRKLCEEEATTPSYKHNQLMLKYKESDFYKEIKNTFNGRPTFDKFILNEDKDYPNPAYKMVNIMQILQNENALTNDYINKMFADLKIYRFNKDKLFPVLLDYLLYL